MQAPLDRSSGPPTPSPVRGDAAVNSTLLREQQAEREKLLMDNFNQALRINYLEERLLRVKQGTDFAGEDLESEVAQLRIALEEREHDIKQRNFAMIRATEAIDVLTGQLGAAKDENARLAAELEQAINSASSRKDRVDPDLIDKWRRELERAAEQEHAAAARVRQLETELSQHQDTIASMTARMHEMEEARARAQMDMEAALQLERQKAAQQLEIAQVKASAELEHVREVARQREEQLAASKERVESLMKEKEAMDARYQSKMKHMEEEVQQQMQQLRQESDKYRAEHTRLLTDREKTHFDRERLAMETESVKQERARLQTEIERLSNELQQFAGDAERLRLQNVKLTALCEEQAKSLDAFREEREKAADSIQQLEGGVHHWRKAAAEHELTVKTLEMRIQQAEMQVKTLEGQCEMAAVRSQQTSNERLAVLEKERYAIEQDNHQLQLELTKFQHELEALEQKFHSCEQRLSEETAKAQEYQSRSRDFEDELARREADVKELERRVAELQASSSMTENSRLLQQNDAVTRFAAEKNDLLASMQQERRRADSAEHSLRDVEAQHSELVKEMEAAAREVRFAIGQDQRSQQNDRTPLAYLVRDAISGIQRDFKSEITMVQTRCEQKISTMSSHLDHLSKQLAASQGKLETLKYSTVHSKDEKRSVERSWASRYESLRAESEKERRELQEEARRLQERLGASENALSRAKTDLEKLSRERSTSQTEWESDYSDLKESNRLLYDEVQERRRAAEHARKQYMRAVRENKELLAAIDLYKKAVAEREKDIEYYKGVLMKYTQQLQRRVSMGEVKQTLLEQLEQTQFMINATYKRWSESDLGKDSDPAADAESSAVVVQLDEYIGRMELVTERWGEFVAHAKELHHRYGDAWQSAVIRLGASPRSTANASPPRWVEDVERKCMRLLNESVRVSESMRDAVENTATAIQRERDERKQREKERALRMASSPRKDRNANDWREAGTPRGGAFASDLAFHDLKSTANQRSADAYSSPVKKRAGSMAAANGVATPSRRSSTKQLAARLGAGNPGVYSNSLASLGRLGVELENIEKRIRKEHA